MSPQTRLGPRSPLERFGRVPCADCGGEFPPDEMVERIDGQGNTASFKCELCHAAEGL